MAVRIDLRGKNQWGEKNPAWKGNGLSYGGIHARMKGLITKTENCEMCKKEKARDLANKSGKYLLKISDWQWLCRKCHMNSDGRMKKLMKNNLPKYSKKQIIEILKRFKQDMGQEATNRALRKLSSKYISLNPIYRIFGTLSEAKRCAYGNPIRNKEI